MDAAVRQLAKNRRSGSVELALRACKIFEAPGLGGSRQRASAQTIVRCGRLARAVVQAQPSMAAS